MLVRPPTEPTAPSPWQRGGVMSDPERWFTPGRAPGVGGDVATGSTGPNHRMRRAGVASAALLIAVGAAAVIRAQLDDGGTASDRPTAIGVVEWQVSVGDATSLPAGLARRDGARLAGTDADGAVSWTSDDGRVWVPGRRPPLELAGERWSVGDVDGRPMLLTGDDLRPAVVTDEQDRLRFGIIPTWSVRGTVADDVLLATDDAVFAAFVRRDEVDWRSLLRLGPTDPYRVHVVAGEREWTFASPDGGTTSTAELQAVTRGDEVVFTNAIGSEVWVVERPSGDAGTDVSAAIQPRETTRWTRRGTTGFRAVPAPWRADDLVDVVPIGDRLLAVAVVTSHRGPRAWSSDDGLDWDVVELPGDADAVGPIPITVGDGEVSVKVSVDGTTAVWSTSDGRHFERLPDVPGIDHRSRGEFGWVAPDPRSSPIVRVSADGSDWEEIRLDDLLGYDASRWDASLDAVAHGDSIVVVAQVGDVRRVLVGTVSPSPTG